MSTNPWPMTEAEHAAFADWQTEVGEGNTALGFREWVTNQVESDVVYQHTHASVRDGSPAMMVGQNETTIMLVNEEGYEWADPLEQWRPIDEPDTKTCTYCGEQVKRGSSGLLVDLRTEDWWCRANPSNGGDAAPHEEN